MQANLARSGGGAAGGAEQWELIETFTNGHIVWEDSYYNVKISEEPDGTSYNFKAVFVEMESVSENTYNTTLEIFSVNTPAGEVYINNTSLNYKSKGSKGALYALRANGLLFAQNTANTLGNIAACSGNITGINIKFIKRTTSYSSPTNVQFKIYAIRA